MKNKSRDKIKQAIIKMAVVLLAVLILILGLLYTGYLHFNYPAKSEFPIKGIDVSHYQGEIDWNKIKNQNIRFAFIKATEGDDFKDRKFTKNWKEAKANNIDVAGYHFFTSYIDGKLQAKNFIETVPNEAGNLPSVIDLEYDSSYRNQKKSKQEILKEISALEEALYKAYSKRPIFYVTEDFYNDFLLNKFPENPIWYRSIIHKPRIKDNRKWLFWQYHNRGHLKGIKGYVDLNVFNGKDAEYEKLK